MGTWIQARQGHGFCLPTTLPRKWKAAWGTHLPISSSVSRGHQAGSLDWFLTLVCTCVPSLCWFTPSRGWHSHHHTYAVYSRPRVGDPKPSTVASSLLAFPKYCWMNTRGEWGGCESELGARSPSLAQAAPTGCNSHVHLVPRVTGLPTKSELCSNFGTGWGED